MRPLGPSVTLTASARISTPRISRERASAPNRTSFAAMVVVLLLLPSGSGLGGFLGDGGGGLDDAHDIGLRHDQQLHAVELDLGAGPLAEQDAVTGLDAERHQ